MAAACRRRSRRGEGGEEGRRRHLPERKGRVHNHRCCGVLWACDDLQRPGLSLVPRRVVAWNNTVVEITRGGRGERGYSSEEAAHWGWRHSCGRPDHKVDVRGSSDKRVVVVWVAATLMAHG